MSTPNAVTRFEVIDHRDVVFANDLRGRVFTVTHVQVMLAYQDDGRTLKVFVSDRAPSASPEETTDDE